jgi:hypothetical protein
MRGIARGLVALLLASESALAGAWTLPRGTAQLFSGATVSRAIQRYDNKGGLVGPVLFNKIYVQNWMEYGLTDAFTAIAAPQYITAETTPGYHVTAPSLEIGGRLLLSKRVGMLSLQASAKTAGAFDMSTSASGQGGRQRELRLLYGTSFKAFGHDGFIDIEGAKRWIKRPRPDEFVMDMTLGLWPTRHDLVLLQSFVTVSAGGQRRPYEPYRQFKLEASLVHRLTAHWSVQSGYFFTWAGRNTVKESGYAGTIWFRM